MRNGMIINKWGNKREWFQNDLLHRLDGPAVEYTNGISKWWYRNGLLHCEDGPAVERKNGCCEWWLNNVEYTEEEYKQELLVRKWGLKVDEL